MEEKSKAKRAEARLDTNKLISNIKENYDYFEALKKINISRRLPNQAQRKLMHSIESHTSNCKCDCKKCAYRDYESSSCYYMMLTNKKAINDDMSCDHFVDAIFYLAKQDECK